MPIYQFEHFERIAKAKNQMVGGSQSRVDRRALVIFPGALGDLICLGPAIRALARRHPEMTAELMARGELARFAVGRIGATSNAPGIVRGHSHSLWHSIDRREMSLLFAPGGGKVAEAASFFGQFVTIYSFFAGDNPLFRENLAIAAPGADLHFHPFRPTGEGHAAALYLRCVNGLRYVSGDALESADSRIHTLPEDLDRGSKILSRNGLGSGDYVLILPGSGSAAKNWPALKFAELSALIAKTARVLIVLGPAEDESPSMRRIFENVAEGHGNGVSVTGGLELAELAAIAKLSRGFVGNDSGVSHLAAAAGAPGVVLFGPTDPARWRPLGAVEVMRHQPLPELRVEEVFATIMRCQIA